MKKYSLVAVALLLPLTAQAQTIGYSFLRTAIGARPAGMAASFVAVSNDMHSIFHNPAGIGDLEQRSAGFGYLNHVLDIQNFSGVYVAPVKRGSYGFALQYTNYGDFTRTNQFGEEQGSFGAYNMVAYLSYSRKQTERLLLGGNAKYIRSSLADFSSDALALDLGVIYHSDLFSNVTFGFGIYNLGAVVSAFDQTKERLPLNFQVGISKTLTHLPLMYSLALVKYAEEDFEFRAGGEFTLAQGFFARLGYDTIGSEQKIGTDGDRFAGFSVGLGLAHRRYRFDYGLSSFGEVGSLNRLNISMEF